MLRRERLRAVFLRIHRTIGLFAGAIFVLIGLSGSILSYREDIDEWLNAPIMRVDAPSRAALRPIDEILTAAVAAMPADAQPAQLTMPRHPRAAAVITYLVETADLQSDLYELFVDPYTAKVKGQRLSLHGDDVFSQPLIPIIMAFHWTLLLGANNAYIIGAAGILVFFSIFIGFYLWLPRNSDWRLGLKVKWGASPERVVYDIHRSVGAYFAALLLVVLFTGVAMIFKPQTRAAVNLFSTVSAEPDYGRSTPIPGFPPIGAGDAVAIADKIFPDGTLRSVLLPNGPNGVYVVGKLAPEEPNRTTTFRNVSIDQYSRNVLVAQDRRRFGPGDTFLEWIYPLHSGEAFGEIGRPLVLLIGLVPFTLYLTGFLRWRQKRRALRGPA